MERYIEFHQHPRQLAEGDVNRFLTHLAGKEHVGGVHAEPGAVGHKDVRTVMIYIHVLNRGGRGVRSPADGLARSPDER